jgi:hypothetical protein
VRPVHSLFAMGSCLMRHVFPAVFALSRHHIITSSQLHRLSFKSKSNLHLGVRRRTMSIQREAKYILFMLLDWLVFVQDYKSTNTF